MIWILIVTIVLLLVVDVVLFRLAIRRAERRK
jgi:hypothetical protein